MNQYQTVLYKAIYVDEQLGWEIEKRSMFKSRSNEDPNIVMQELNFFEPTHSNRIGNIRMIDDGKIIEEEWFVSSVSI